MEIVPQAGCRCAKRLIVGRERTVYFITGAR
jgi:hypothetical protein